jgi:phosphatidylglycerol:prolipoprotein diacylglycerol transferase
MWLWTVRKSDRPIGWIFGVYLVIAGVERFLIEILRAKDDRFLGPFTLAQLTSVILVAIGIWVMVKLREGASSGPGAYLTTGKKAA